MHFKGPVSIHVNIPCLEKSEKSEKDSVEEEEVSVEDNENEGTFEDEVNEGTVEEGENEGTVEEGEKEVSVEDETETCNDRLDNVGDVEDPNSVDLRSCSLYQLSKIHD